MKVKRIYAVNFRNYKECCLEITSMVNIFYGQNAQGKTNLLEAMFYAAFGMSHRTAQEDDMQRLDQVLRELQPVLRTLNNKSNALVFEAAPQADPQPKKAKN